MKGSVLTLRKPIPLARSIRWVPAGLFTPPRTLDDLALFITQGALRDVMRHLRSNPEQELLGFLLGELYECPETGSRYVVVNTAVRTGHAIAESDRLLIPEEEWLGVQLEVRRRRTQLLGWYHSAPFVGPHPARADLETHRALFAEPWQCGLVIATTGDAPAGAFFRSHMGERNGGGVLIPFYEIPDDDEPLPADGRKRTLIDWVNYETRGTVERDESERRPFVPRRTPTPHSSPVILTVPSAPEDDAYAGPGTNGGGGIGGGNRDTLGRGAPVGADGADGVHGDRDAWGGRGAGRAAGGPTAQPPVDVPPSAGPGAPSPSPTPPPAAEPPAAQPPLGGPMGMGSGMGRGMGPIFPEPPPPPRPPAAGVPVMLPSAAELQELLAEEPEDLRPEGGMLGRSSRIILVLATVAVVAAAFMWNRGDLQLPDILSRLPSIADSAPASLAPPENELSSESRPGETTSAGAGAATALMADSADSQLAFPGTVSESAGSTAVSPPPVAQPAAGAGAASPPVPSTDPEVQRFSELSDSLEQAIRNFRDRSDDFAVKRLTCEGLAVGYRAADDAFIALASAHRSARDVLDTTSESRYRQLVNEMGKVNEEFGATECPRP